MKARRAKRTSAGKENGLMARICWLASLCIAGSAHAQTAPDPCPPQPLPPAIDSAGPWSISQFMHAITFAATPSLEHPGRAWVVRLSRNGPRGDGSLSIIRLRRQRDCNRYDVERRWDASLAPAEYRAVADSVTPFVALPANVFASDGSFDGQDTVAVDGTSLILGVQNMGWKVRRSVHHSSRSGAALSSIMHALVRKHVPANEVPAANWRTRRQP